MAYEITIITICIIFIIGGIIGCLIPTIPGPPVAYTAMLIAHFASERIQFSKLTLIIIGIFTALTFIIDFIFPIFGAKLYGVSKKGLACPLVGMLIGLIFFPPLGAIIGALLGAIFGELAAGKKDSQALKAGIVVFIGSMLSILFQLTVATTILALTIIEIF
jgi:uncharacterized protein